MIKVLCVDDERIIREGLIGLIDWENYGCEIVFACKNGQEAYDFALRNQVDLIITDVKMPVLNGLELIEKLSKEKKKTKFIVISGFGEFEFAITAMRFGVKHYLLKPYTKEKLIEAIEEIKLELDYYKSPDDEYKNKKLTHWIKDILLYVDKNLENPQLSLKNIANDIIHVNPGYLSRMFNKEMGESFPHFVMRKRMELAKKLIIEYEDDKIYEVADKIGFSDNPQYFSQVFKSYTGFTPSEYRAKKISEEI